MAFNKLYIMLPVMFAARKLDSEDAQTVYWIRIAYGVIQTICFLAVVYTYVKASSVAATARNIVYVPPAPQVCLWTKDRKVEKEELGAFSLARLFSFCLSLSPSDHVILACLLSYLTQSSSLYTCICFVSFLMVITVIVFIYLFYIQCIFYV
jgi:hypothetical protein